MYIKIILIVLVISIVVLFIGSKMAAFDKKNKNIYREADLNSKKD